MWKARQGWSHGRQALCFSGSSAQQRLPAGSANHLSPRMGREAEKELKRPRQKTLDHSGLASQGHRLPSWPTGKSSALARNHLAGSRLLPPKGSLGLLVPAQSNELLQAPVFPRAPQELLRVGFGQVPREGKPEALSRPMLSQ